LRQTPRIRTGGASALRAAAIAAPAIAGSIALSLTGPAAQAQAAETAPRTQRVAATSGASSYVVHAGDTVSAIAARHGLRTSDVLSWNHLGWSTRIYPGQVLRLTPPTAKATATHAPAAPVAQQTVYVVRAGDTVTAIARKYGVSIDTVLTANRLTRGSIIYPGQKLVIRTAASAPARTAPAALDATNAASVTRTAYVVRAGDTISAIARRNAVTVDAMLRANRLSWSSIIYPGQRLVIPTTAVPGLTAEQTRNARLIVSVGRQLGVPSRGIAIALGTAMQESGLRNLTYGDRDSLGLFQQRPSTGWGTAAQVKNAEYAARAFFLGRDAHGAVITRGLLDIPGWQRMSFTQAAQAVQISAYPNAYARWEKPALQWLAALS